MSANLENSAVTTGLEKVGFHSNLKEGNAKECSNYHTIALISHTSKAMLKILQARLQQYMNRELPDVQAGIRKGRGTRAQIANICWIIEKVFILSLLAIPWNPAFRWIYLSFSPLPLVSLLFSAICKASSDNE